MVRSDEKPLRKRIELFGLPVSEADQLHEFISTILRRKIKMPENPGFVEPKVAANREYIRDYDYDTFDGHTPTLPTNLELIE